MNEIAVCLSTDDHYARHCGVAITSILANADADDALHFYILNGGLSLENQLRLRQTVSFRPCIMEFVHLDPEVFKVCPILEDRHFTVAAYYRLMIPSLLDHLDKVLYLDCDVVVLSSLMPLFSTGLEEYCAAMVVDEKGERHRIRLGIPGKHYYNSGVVLMNCKKWREDGIEGKLFEWAGRNSDKIVFADQDILNAVLYGQVRQLDRRFNLFEELFSFGKPGIWRQGEKPDILHFIGRQKPWNFLICSKAHRIYFQYLKKTPWEQEKIKTFLSYIKRRTRFQVLRRVKKLLRLLSPALFRKVKAFYIEHGGKPIE